MRLTLVTATGLIVSSCSPAATPAPTTVAPKETPKPSEPTKAAEATKAVAVEPTKAPPVAASKYKESPMLTALVTAGKLPPIDQRMVADPRVRTVPKVGKHGGTLFDVLGTLHGHFGIRGSALPYCLEPNNVGNETYPDLCSKVEMSADKKEATFYFRKGLKYSDGNPFTADDVVWWWENQQLNKDISPNGPSAFFVVGGQPMTVEKVDANTVKLKFSKPYRPIINMAASSVISPGVYFGVPVQFMKQFHIKTNPDADTVAKKYGFDKWFQVYAKMVGETPAEFGKPTLGPWWKVGGATDREDWERNPYSHEVDQEGNQLPYIDKWSVSLVPDAKMQVAKASAGEISIKYGDLIDIDGYKAGMTKGGYRILDWKYSNPAAAQLAFNLNHLDPVLNKIYNDVRFRQAMSVAINRKEINTTLYFGQAKEVQSTINYAASYYKESWGTTFAQYDTNKANELLDVMGLKWDADKKVRLRPDGKPLETVLTYATDVPIPILEMVKTYWDKVGNKTTLLSVARALRDERGLAAQLDCTTWNTDRTEEIACYLPWATKFQPNTEMYYAVNWWTWYVTNGKSGTEPPQEWKDQFNRMANWYSCTTDEEYKKLATDVWQFFSDQVVCIGTVGYAPMPTIVKNGLQNVPDFMWKGYGTGHSKSQGFNGFFWDNV